VELFLFLKIKKVKILFLKIIIFIIFNLFFVYIKDNQYETKMENVENENHLKNNNYDLIPSAKLNQQQYGESSFSNLA